MTGSFFCLSPAVAELFSPSIAILPLQEAMVSLSYSQLQREQEQLLVPAA